MKSIGLKLFLLTLLLATALPSDRDINPPAFAQALSRGAFQEPSEERPAAYSSERPVHSGNNHLGQDPDHSKRRTGKKLHSVLVKNISVVPNQVTNDGSGHAEIRCSVFTPNDHAHIKSVKLLFSQGVRSPAAIQLFPDPENILSSSAEGEYVGRIHVPWLMDSGIHTFQVAADDSLGLTGKRSDEIEICYRQKAELPGVDSPEFIEILELLSGHYFVPNNRIEILDSGEKALRKRLALIEKAQYQINLQTYTFDAGGLCKQISDAMLKKAHQGIEVNIILNTDSQIPTSPINTLRLKLQGILHDWTTKAEELTQETLASR